MPDAVRSHGWFVGVVEPFRGGFLGETHPPDEAGPRLLWSQDGKAWSFLDGGAESTLGGTTLVAAGERILLYGTEIAKSPDIPVVWEISLSQGSVS